MYDCRLIINVYIVYNYQQETLLSYNILSTVFVNSIFLKSSLTIIVLTCQHNKYM